MKYSVWQIVLVKYPFTDLSNTKLRPALVIGKYENDIILFPITTKKTWLTIEIKLSDLESWELLTNSYVKVNSIFTISSHLILTHIAKLKKSKLDKILHKFIFDILHLSC